MGVLYPIGERTFVSGPSLIAGFPVELTVTFDAPPAAPPMPTLRADDGCGRGSGMMATPARATAGRAIRAIRARLGTRREHGARGERLQLAGRQRLARADVACEGAGAAARRPQGVLYDDAGALCEWIGELVGIAADAARSGASSRDRHDSRLRGGDARRADAVRGRVRAQRHRRADSRQARHGQLHRQLGAGDASTISRRTRWLA